MGPKTWQDYVDLQLQDKKTLRRINKLIKSALRTPDAGEGDPERLRGDLSGCWSRRINEKDRLVYRVADGVIQILQCRGHYSDT